MAKKEKANKAEIIDKVIKTVEYAIAPVTAILAPSLQSWRFGIWMPAYMSRPVQVLSCQF